LYVQYLYYHLSMGMFSGGLANQRGYVLMLFGLGPSLHSTQPQWPNSVLIKEPNLSNTNIDKCTNNNKSAVVHTKMQRCLRVIIHVVAGRRVQPTQSPTWARTSCGRAPRSLQPGPSNKRRLRPSYLYPSYSISSSESSCATLFLAARLVQRAPR